MKMKFKFALMFAAAAMVCAGFTSCSSDDDEGEENEFFPGNLWVGNLEAAAHSSEAALYTIENPERNGSPYKSIELLESGNYIVTMSSLVNSYSPASRSEGVAEKGVRKSMFHQKKEVANSRYYNDYRYSFGEYTRNSDGSYTLDGLANTTFNFSNNSVSMTTAGVTTTLPASKAVPADNNTLNSRLCRTWDVVEVYEQVTVNGQTTTYQVPSSEIKDDYVKSVIVSRAGTFLQVDWDDYVDSHGTWYWSNTDQQVFNYNFSDEEGSGSVTVAFNGNRATFFESEREYDEDYGLVTFTYKTVCVTR